MAVMRYPGGVSPEFGGVFFRSKIASAAPRLVANAPETDVKRLRITCACPRVGKRRAPSRGVAVFHPAIKFLSRQAPQIGRQVRLTSNQFAEMAELVRSEFVRIIAMARRRVLGFTFGPKVRPTRALVARSDAIAPIVAVCKTAARKTHHRRLGLAHLVDQLLADTVDIRDARSFAHPDAVVNDATQVLREVTVDIGRNGSKRLVEQDFDGGLGSAGAPRPKGRKRF